MDPRIIAVSGPLKDQVFRLADGRVSVGRESVEPCARSRRHRFPPALRYRMHDEQVEVTDLESHNGTFVNGIPVNKRTLHHGDVLRVGQSELLFLTEASAPELPPRVSCTAMKPRSDILKTVKLRDSRTSPFAYRDSGAWPAT